MYEKWHTTGADTTGVDTVVPFAGPTAGATKALMMGQSMSSLMRGAYDVYAYKKAYGRSPKYVTPWGPRSMARKGGRSMAPSNIERYYR